MGKNWTRWFFHLDTLTWEGKGNAKIDCISGIAYDPTTNKVFCREIYYIHEYDLESDTYTERYLFNGGWWCGTPAAIDPINRKMLFIGCGKLGVFDLETYSFTFYDETNLTGNTEILYGTAVGFEYNPIVNKFVAWSGERPVKELLPQVAYVIDPVTLIFEKRYSASTNTVIPTESARRGTYGRFRYSPNKDIFIVVNSIYENVYVYKLSNFVIPQLGFGSTTNITEPVIETNRHSIGIEWSFDGDDNHNAETSVHYRVVGTSAWKEAMPLFRVDFVTSKTNLNMMAGSIMFLKPATTYEVKLDFLDPDGGSELKILEVTTRPIPALPTGGRTFHVETGSGGGNGSEINPFKGVSSALAVAQPGDIFLLHAGNYEKKQIFNKAGSPGNYIVWKAAGDGAVRFNGIKVTAQYNWIEGFDIKGGLLANNACPAVFLKGANGVFSKNIITGGDGCRGNSYLITVGSDNWTITDNTLIGDVDPALSNFGGEGIELWYSSGHTIAYNSITHVADGISYPGRNVDIFGNEIFDVADDGIELDFAYPNVRVWKNRVTNALSAAISLQDIYHVPSYIIGNELIGYGSTMLKIRMPGMYVFLHNTVVSWDSIFLWQREYIAFAYLKNNLIVSYNGMLNDNRGLIWHFGNWKKNWMTDIDFNGFDWADYPTPFFYNRKKYADLNSYSSVSGLDTNSIVIEKERCFDNLTLNGPYPAPTPFQHLTLKAGCNAIDSGVVLPNINDGYLGSAPDMGAYEFGAELPHYGPRTQKY